MGGVTDIPEEEYIEKMEEINKGFEEEGAKWDELGMESPARGYKPDLFILANGFDVLKNLLIDKGILGDREINLALRELMLNNMIKIRQDLEPQIIEARRQALVARSMPPDLGNGQGRLPFEQ